MGIRRRRRSTLPMLLVVIVLVSAACGRTETPAGDELPEPATTVGNSGSDEGVTTVTSDDLIDVLAAAAAHRVTVDNSFGGGAPFEYVDVIETLAVTVIDGSLDARAGRPLTDLERAAVTSALAPLPVEFVPATVFDELDPADGPGGRAIVTLAEPATVDGRLVIASQLWCGGLCGIGGSHELVHAADGTWSIGEPVGPQWIS